MNHENTYVFFDYLEITADKKQLSFLLDCYTNFGWQLDENIPVQMENSHYIIHFKRHRKIANKTELIRLQRHFESSLKELQHLEESKKVTADVLSLSIGICGTLCILAAAFALTTVPKKIGLFMLTIIPGILGWLIPPLLYHRLILIKSRKVDPYIEQKYDEVAELCQKGHDLL